MKNYYLYLIRHGITQGNLDGKYIGQTDLSLCPEGKKQIEDLVAKEVYPEVEKVYSSPLARCLETAEIIYPEQKLMVVDEICEMNFGDFENKTQNQLKDLHEYTEWLKGGAEAAPPNGEKYGDFMLRCIEGLDAIFTDMMNRDITYATCPASFEEYGQRIRMVDKILKDKMGNPPTSFARRERVTR